jgi:methylated-DNA-[protein]-cysteine S-methyltransferase
MELLLETIETEIGKVIVVSDGKSICAVDYEGYEPRMRSLLRARFGEFSLEPHVDSSGFSQRLRSYFMGDLHAIEEIPVNLAGTTFQRRVWMMLRRIPAGTTMSYGALAAKLGAPSAARAVGFANSLNPIAIIIPCHRLVGANGKLTGYAGGLSRKAWLLAHERNHTCGGIEKDAAPRG